MIVRLADSPAGKKQAERPTFIYVPSMNAHVRSDLLDFLSDAEWRVLMAQLAAVQPDVSSGKMSEGQWMADRASRRAKRQQKQQRKQDKSDAKLELKKARAESIRSGKRADVLGSVVSGLKSLIPGAGGSDTLAPETQGAAGTQGSDNPPSDGMEKTPWYKDPVKLTIGVGGVALLGYGIYKVSQRN